LGVDINFTSGINPLEEYKLSVLLGADNFFYGLYNSAGKLVKSNFLTRLASNDLSTQAGLQGILKVEGIDGLKITRSVIGIDNNKFTFVPFSDYEKTQKQLYLKNTIAIEDNEEIFVDFKNSVCTVFAVDKIMFQNITKSFPNPEIVHIQTALHNELSMSHRNAALVDINNQGVKVQAIKNGKLLLSNNYETNENLGILYFAALAYEKLGLDKKSYPLFLSGNITKENKAYDLLKKYIGDVNFMDPDSIKSVAGNHRYYTLHCLSKCG